MNTPNELTDTEALAIAILEDLEARQERFPLSASILQTAAAFGITTAEVRATVASAIETMAARS